jgi:choline dehydrogenase
MSRDSRSAPQIDPAYLSDADGEDLHRLVLGVRKAREIAAAPPLARQGAGETEPGSSAATDADIARFIRSRAHTIYHPVGSCRMGEDGHSVVDQRLAVRGVNNLWIADASVIPSIPRGHPHAVVAAIADRATAFILNAASAQRSAA